MCGIAGKVCWTGPVDQSLVERMCRVIEHRGPDSRGTFVDDGIGLGVQRLAVIDLDTGHQPVANEDGSVVVILNGEVYNYRELRAELARRGHRLATRSDTEVIVHLYEDHGDDCVQHLRGMFAFALWDRHRRRLLLARDRLGKKPLFYGVTDDCLWFGSDPKAILADPAVPRDVSLEAIDSYLHYQYVPQPLSAFAALRKLPPAHVLTCEHRRTAIRRYWRLSYVPALARTPEPELHALIRERLLEATGLRLRSDVPLGALLSGGIDSSSVVAAMSRRSPERVKTFSIGFDVPEFDETGYAREVASLYGTDHHELTMEPQSVDVLPRLVWHHGEPFADQSAIPTFYLSELTRQHVTVALDGTGGDEAFAGYNRYIGLGDGRRRAEADRVLSLYSRRLSYGYFDDGERRDLYQPELLGVLGEGGWRSVIADPYFASDAPDVAGRILDVDVQTYLPDDLLVKVDTASMAHSLEVRSPLLDHVFMETAAAIPTDRKLRGETTKSVYKDALRGWLPDRILDRPKMGFSVPLEAWFRGSLRELPGEVLLDPRSLQRGLFREEVVRRIIADHISGAADNSSKIWALLQLELWLRTYVDEARSDAPIALSVA